MDLSILAYFSSSPKCRRVKKIYGNLNVSSKNYILGTVWGVCSGILPTQLSMFGFWYFPLKINKCRFSRVKTLKVRRDLLLESSWSSGWSLLKVCYVWSCLSRSCIFCYNASFGMPGMLQRLAQSLVFWKCETQNFQNCENSKNRDFWKLGNSKKSGFLKNFDISKISDFEVSHFKISLKHFQLWSKKTKFQIFIIANEAARWHIPIQRWFCPIFKQNKAF